MFNKVQWLSKANRSD